MRIQVDDCQLRASTDSYGKPFSGWLPSGEYAVGKAIMVPIGWTRPGESAEARELVDVDGNVWHIGESIFRITFGASMPFKARLYANRWTVVNDSVKRFPTWQEAADYVDAAIADGKAIGGGVDELAGEFGWIVADDGPMVTA